MHSDAARIITSLWKLHWVFHIHHFTSFLPLSLPQNYLSMKMVKPIWRRVFFHLIFLNSTEVLPQTADQIEQGFPCIFLASILNWKIDYKNLTKVIQDSRGHDWYFRKQTKDPRVYFLNTVISTPVRFWLSLLLYHIDFSWKITQETASSCYFCFSTDTSSDNSSPLVHLAF